MYAHIVSMRTNPGRRADVVELLVRGVDGLAAHGCVSYVVGTDPDDPDRIWVTEVWVSQQAHAASLELPKTKAAIAGAMPMLTGEFTGQGADVAGGLGV